MRLPDTLTDAQGEAVIACLIEFARHGRAIRLQRQAEEQKAKSAEMQGSDAADFAESNGGTLLPKDTTDAN